MQPFLLSKESKVIDDVDVSRFIHNRMTPRLRKKLGIKKPWFGKNRGKYLVPYNAYATTIEMLVISRNRTDIQKFDYQSPQ